MSDECRAMSTDRVLSFPRRRESIRIDAASILMDPRLREDDGGKRSSAIERLEDRKILLEGSDELIEHRIVCRADFRLRRVAPFDRT